MKAFKNKREVQEFCKHELYEWISYHSMCPAIPTLGRTFSIGEVNNFENSVIDRHKGRAKFPRKAYVFILCHNCGYMKKKNA